MINSEFISFFGDFGKKVYIKATIGFWLKEYYSIFLPLQILSVSLKEFANIKQYFGIEHKKIRIKTKIITMQLFIIQLVMIDLLMERRFLLLTFNIC